MYCGASAWRQFKQVPRELKFACVHSHLATPLQFYSDSGTKR